MIGDRHDLAQLVGNQDDGLALVAQRCENAKQVISFVGCKHTRGLIENESFSALVERLEDFDALLQTHRKLADDSIRIHIQFILIGQPFELRAGLGQGRSNQRTAFNAQHNIFQHCKRFNQHEMLVHHANAKGDGIGRGFDFYRIALDPDLTLVGGIKAKQD